MLFHTQCINNKQDNKIKPVQGTLIGKPGIKSGKPLQNNRIMNIKTIIRNDDCLIDGIHYFY
jgi:hypothetical protein